MNKSYTRGAVLATLVLACGAANAVEYKITAGVSSERTNNVARASDQSGLRQSDWVHRPFLRGLLDHETKKLLLSADYLVEHRIYTEDVFDDRTRWTGQANLRWDAVQDFLQFNASNSRTETTEDSLNQDIESNRQVTTVTSAGPRLFFRPRSSDELSVEYRYSDIGQDETDTDSDRQLLSVAYKLGFTENRSLTAEVSRDKVDFDLSTASELEIDTATLTYASLGDALEIRARGGYTTIDRTLGREEIGGAIGSLDLLWRVTGSGQIELNASRSINDQSDDVLRGNAGFGQGSVFENSNVNEVFEEDIVRLSYTHRWGRNTATLGYSLQLKEFDDDAFALGDSRDEDETGFRANYARRLTPRIDARIGASILKREFDEDRNIDEDNFTADFRLDWRTGRALSLYAGASYENRDASGDLALAQLLSFDEFTFLFGITFDFVDRYKRPQQR